MHLVALRVQVGEPFAVVDPHVDLVDSYVELAERESAAVAAALETHVQADTSPAFRRSSIGGCRRRTSRPAQASDSSIERSPTVRSWKLGTTGSRPSQRPGTRALAVDHRKILALPDHLLLIPARYAGSVCGRGLSATPVPTLGFERRNNPLLTLGSEDDFVDASTAEPLAMPDQVETVVELKRSGEAIARSASR